LGTWPMFIQSFRVGSGDISLVTGKSILRKIKIQFAHDAVSRYFCNDRCGTYRNYNLIALPDCKIRNTQTFDRIPIS